MIGIPSRMAQSTREPWFWLEDEKVKGIGYRAMAMPVARAAVIRAEGIIPNKPTHTRNCRAFESRPGCRMLTSVIESNRKKARMPPSPMMDEEAAE